MSLIDQRHKEELEVLAGRRGAKSDHALRNKDLQTTVATLVGAEIAKQRTPDATKLETLEQSFESLRTLLNKFAAIDLTAEGLPSIANLKQIVSGADITLSNIPTSLLPAPVMVFSTNAENTASLGFDVPVAVNAVVTVSVHNGEVLGAGADPTVEIRVDDVETPSDSLTEIESVTFVSALDPGSHTITTTIATATTGTYTGRVYITVTAIPS